MFCRPMLGESPLLSTPFSNLTIDKSFEAVSRKPAKQENFLPVHDLSPNDSIAGTPKSFSASDRSPVLTLQKINRISFGLRMSSTIGERSQSKAIKVAIRRATH